MLTLLTAKVTGQALILAALTAQALLDPDSAQVVVQAMILAGIVVQGAITILTHKWDREDRARKQAELIAETEAQSTDVKREVVATTQLQIATTKAAVEEVVKKTNGGSVHAPAREGEGE